MAEALNLTAVVPSSALPYVPASATSLLDVGCDVGTVLQEAYRVGIHRLYGIDINPRSIETARERLRLLGVDVANIVHGSGDSLPFPDASIDVATSFETLEHVPSELRPSVIREVCRVLRPGARFIITTPAAGLFAWLDPANVRLRFPRIFRLISGAVGGQGRERGYEGQKHGIVWHHHFNERELRTLFEPLFVIDRTEWRGCLLAPLCACLAFPFYRRQKFDSPILKLLHRVELWEVNVAFPPTLACNVLVVARKPE
jgi:SAM-dependent methyltransferase